jgi:hypothetical protein
MTWLTWLFIAFCWALPILFYAIARRRIHIHSVHRDSVHFPEPGPFLCTDLVLERKPCAAASLAQPPAGWCYDCGWQNGRHALDCPQMTGERCPRCAKPKRTAHACHYCGFAGFLVIVNLSSSSSRKTLPTAEGADPC